MNTHSAAVKTGTKLWIINGAFWFLLAAYAWGSWILGPDFVDNAHGRELASEGYVPLGSLG